MMDDPAYQAMMKKNNQTPMFLQLDEFGKFLADKQQRYTAGLKK